jgi:hypothetical protein
VGTYFSIRSRSALNAFLWTLGFGLAVNLVVPVGLTFLLRDKDPLCMSPAIGLVPVVWKSGRSFLGLGDDPSNAVACSVGYIILSCGLLALMTAQFDQLVGRTPSIPLRGSLRFRFRRFLLGDKPD